MKTVLVCVVVLLALGLVTSGPAGREKRQSWSFPGEDNQNNVFQQQPGRQTSTTRRTTTTTPRPGGSTSSTAAPGVIFNVPNCNCPSPPQYNPVCGTDGNTYGNQQKLNCARQCGANVQMARLGVCQTPRRRR